MRILANYGYRNNGDSYSVSFETMGDVPRDIADSVVDDLFSLAKSAIQRQIRAGANPQEPAAKDNHVEIPELKKQANGNGKHANGNGNGKPVMKDPEAPISGKQKSLIIKLAKEKGEFIEGLGKMNMQEASQIIEELLATVAS